MNLPLLALGLLMVGVGALVPGTQPSAVTALILTGSGFLAAGVLAPLYREFEIGPTKLRFAQSDAPPPAPWMVAEADTLTNIARLALGDSRLSRDAVENALGMMKRVPRRIPSQEREVLKLKTLVASLDKADHKRKLAGGAGREEFSTGSVHRVLQGLEFPVRIAFALRTEFPVREVAEILERTESDVAAQIQMAEAALACVTEEQDGG